MNEAELLARAKRGLSPTRDDELRVRAALQHAVTSGQPSASDAARPTLPAAAKLPAVAKLGAALLLAAATGSAGYWLGFRAGSATKASEPPRVVERTVLVPRGEAAAPAEPVTSAPKDPPTKPSRSLRALPSASSVTAAEPAESPLELETRFLARVERSLRSENPRLALGLLGELDRLVPDGQLVEERRAGHVVAHCQLGSESAAKLAQDFAARFPSSAYAARIEQACAANLEPR